MALSTLLLKATFVTLCLALSINYCHCQCTATPTVNCCADRPIDFKARDGLLMQRRVVLHMYNSTHPFRKLYTNLSRNNEAIREEAEAKRNFLFKILAYINQREQLNSPAMTKRPMISTIKVLMDAIIKDACKYVSSLTF